MADLLDGVRVDLDSISSTEITLGLPVIGFRSVEEAGGVDNHVYSWVIEANFDGSGVAQDREGGTGHWDSGYNLIGRNTVWSTEPDNAQITVSGDTHVIITPLALDFREQLTAHRTYYVRTDGDDANSGLFNTAAGAFETVTGALDYVTTHLDFNGYTVTVSIGAGTYTVTSYSIPSPPGGGILTIRGQSDETLVTLTTAAAYSVFRQDKPLLPRLVIQDLTLTNTFGSNTAHAAIWASTSVYFENVVFGSLGGSGSNALDLWTSSVVVEIANCTFATGNATCAVQVYSGATLWAYAGNTVTGTPSYGNGFAFVHSNGTAYFSDTITGSITGPKAVVHTGGVIFEDGAIPGTGYSVEDGGLFAEEGGTSTFGVDVIELGHASDTTVARSSAGNVSIEGNVIYRAGGTDVAIADGGTGVSLADPNDDRILFWDDSGGAVAWLDLDATLATSTTNLGLSSNQKLATITLIIDGGGATITTGVKGYVEVPFACTITAARALADQSGAIVVDIWNDTYANYPPADADSITASAPVTITASGNKSQDTTLTGWDTAIAAGDILGFNVDSVTSHQRVTIALTVVKT